MLEYVEDESCREESITYSSAHSYLWWMDIHVI
jgi:hypothetical protein